MKRRCGMEEKRKKRKKNRQTKSMQDEEEQGRRMGEGREGGKDKRHIRPNHETTENMNTVTEVTAHR